LGRESIASRAAKIGAASLAIALSAGVSAAAEAAPEISPPGDFRAGVAAGILLAALIGYAFFAAARPLLKRRDRGFSAALLMLLALAGLKVIAVSFCPGFTVDVGTYEAWALDIARAGPAAMYRNGFFLDYPPGYLYALWLAGAIARLTGASGAALRVVIEAPALAFDFALAALIFIFVRRSGRPAAAWIAMLFVALNPALLFDTVVWGQTDSVMTAILLLGVVMMLEQETELAWALAALAVIIKPQAFTLLPVLAVWTLLRGDFKAWWRSALAFVAVIVIAAAPFQAGHPWNWLPNLYISTAAYYHETSVNAFNFMALIGGLRQDDAGLIYGVSYYAIGMALLAPLYAFAIWTLWRNPSRRNLLFASFIAMFGFFMFAPRMHERYLYPAVVFAIPLALEEPAMIAVFALLTLTCLFNLAYVLRALNAGVFLGARDTPAMLTSIVNLLAFGLAAVYGRAQAADDPAAGHRGAARIMAALAGVPALFRLTPQPGEDFAPFPWERLDTLLIGAIAAVAAALRFWHLGHPREIVFDEVHFVGQARHYIHGEQFLDPHPPIAKLLIAAGIMLFGDHSWAWRLGNAAMGTILAVVTYPLGRRMFRSRLAAAISAGLVTCDGFFLVDSRIGCIDIVYLTFAAIAYLLMFRFIQSPDMLKRRRILLPLGVALGLCLGSKLYVPGITFLLAGGFILFTLCRPQAAEASAGDVPDSGAGYPLRMRWAAGAALILGSISAIFYLLSFTPHYALGWWGGIADLFRYYKDVMWYEKSVSTATHPYASPWWSWPLMLRPVAYWQNFPPHGDVATIWGAGNPLTWWGVMPAMAITAVRAVERPNITRAFIVIGFLAYFVIWIPIGRILFLYHYMPSAYIGYLALGGVLGGFFNEGAETWESFAILLTLFPVLIVGLGHAASTYKFAWMPSRMYPVAGLPLLAAILIPYVVSIKRPRIAGRIAAAAFLAAAAALFIYYLPVWLGTPIAREGYYARMWLEGPGLRNWI
jgi:Gpi18-like mannosyltransferase/predicted membrane-bound dolichyl-phosphate-mannose-protein mannosyltransferase